jgi:hypothetical protein
MTIAEAFKAARAAGIQLGIDGDHLVLEAAVPPPPAVIDLLSRHKAEVLALLAATEYESNESKLINASGAGQRAHSIRGRRAWL